MCIGSSVVGKRFVGKSNVFDCRLCVVVHFWSRAGSCLASCVDEYVGLETSQCSQKGAFLYSSPLACKFGDMVVNTLLPRARNGTFGCWMLRWDDQASRNLCALPTLSCLASVLWVRISVFHRGERSCVSIVFNGVSVLDHAQSLKQFLSFSRLHAETLPISRMGNTQRRFRKVLAQMVSR
jgi:hypothetical protein